MSQKLTFAVPGVRRAVHDAIPYQPGQFAEEIQGTYPLADIIKIASNENPYGPFPNSIASMQRELSKLNLYPDSNFTDLRAVLGKIHGIGPECISISHGAEGMLQSIGKCFLQEGDEVIIPAITYTLYREISKIMGATVISVPMPKLQVDAEAIEDVVTPHTKLIWLANPNNPTGTIINKDRFMHLFKVIPRTAWIVLDEAYAEFADADLLPDRIRLIREGYQVISVRTFSKAYGLAGARLGYAMADKAVVGVINTVSEPFNANRVALAGALGVLKKDQDIVQQSLSRILDERRRTEERLTKLGLKVIPSHTNFIMFETPVNALILYEKLLTRGIIVRPCNAWGYDHMLRVTVGTPAQMDRFVSALETILAQKV